MRIYLDLCCWNRPFDDLDQPRVKLEAEAVLMILSREGHERCASAGLWVENLQNPDVERREKVEQLLMKANRWIPHSAALEARVLELRQMGFMEFDAYHLATAEADACDCLVTCDDRFLKAARRNANRIKVAVIDPIALIQGSVF